MDMDVDMGRGPGMHIGLVPVLSDHEVRSPYPLHLQLGPQTVTPPASSTTSPLFDHNTPSTTSALTFSSPRGSVEYVQTPRMDRGLSSLSDVHGVNKISESSLWPNSSVMLGEEGNNAAPSADVVLVEQPRLSQGGTGDPQDTLPPQKTSRHRPFTAPATFLPPAFGKAPGSPPGPSFTDTIMTAGDPSQFSLAAANRLLRALSNDTTGSKSSRERSPKSAHLVEEQQIPSPPSVYRKLNSMDPIISQATAVTPNPTSIMNGNSGSISKSNTSPSSSPRKLTNQRTRNITPAEDYVIRFRQESADIASGMEPINSSAMMTGMDLDPIARFRSETYQTMGGQSGHMSSPNMGSGGTPRGRQWTRQSQEGLFGESPYSVGTVGSGSPGFGHGHNGDKINTSRIPLVKRLVSAKPLALSFTKPRLGSFGHRSMVGEAHEPPLRSIFTSSRSRQRSMDSATEPTGLGMGSSPYGPPIQACAHASWQNVPGQADAMTNGELSSNSRRTTMPEPPISYLDRLVAPVDSEAYLRQGRRQSDWQAYQKKKDFLANESEEQRRRREKERVQVWSAWAAACIAVQSTEAHPDHRFKFPVTSQTDLHEARSPRPVFRQLGSHQSLDPKAFLSPRMSSEPGRGSAGESRAHDDMTAAAWANLHLSPQPPSGEFNAQPHTARTTSDISSTTITSRSNPFLAIRSRTANVAVRSLVIEMIVSLAALVDARELIYGETVPLDLVAKDLKRNRSSALIMLRAEREHNPSLGEPDQEDLVFQESEFAALIGDLNDLIGHNSQIEQILQSGTYGIQLAPFKISSADGALRLLIDLEETIWGSADPSPTELPGSFGPLFTPDGTRSATSTPGVYAPHVMHRTLAARDAAPENNLDDLLNVLNTAPHAPAPSSYFDDSYALGTLDCAALDLVKPAAVGPREIDNVPSAMAVAARGRRATEPALRSLPDSRVPFKPLRGMEEEEPAVPRKDSIADSALKEVGRARYAAWKASREMQPLWAKEKESSRTRKA